MKKDIRLWIMGGLGNILYQMILYYRILEEKKKPPTIFKNLTQKNILTKFINFNIHENYFEFFFENIKFKQANFFYFTKSLIFFKTSKIINSSFFYFMYVSPTNEASFIIKNNYNYTGYFQSKNFILKNIIFFKKVLNLVKPKLKKYNHDYVFHFRAHDSNFKKRNIKILKRLIAKHKDKLVVVTDDKKLFNYLIKNFNQENLINSQLLDDFSILSCSKKKLYCSISTLSWWAAHLVEENCEVYFDKKMIDHHGYFGTSSLKFYDD